MKKTMSPSSSNESLNVFLRCVEDSSEAIMISDTQGILSYVNPAWTQIYGYSSGEAVGNTPKLLHSGMHDPTFYREMWERIQDPKFGSWKGELINRAKDGTLVPVLLTITPYRTSPSSEISGYMGMAVDLTYKRELEAKIAHQDRLASIGLLASGLAHEIGTPLGVIRGRAELLGMKTHDAHLKKSLEVITSEIDRISKLIRSLLRVSRSFSDVYLESVSPAAAINTILSLVGQNLRNDSVEIQMLVPDDLRIEADLARTEQVFLNLIMNSIHALQKARSNGQPGPHFLRMTAQDTRNHSVQIHIVDSGCGIAPQNMNKLFKPFFTTKDVGEGTGLGLAIVAQLLREMKGEISVHSTVSVGTTFTLEFPRSADATLA